MTYHQRDLGHCCLLLPLKFGVALISMIIFATGILALVAVLNAESYVLQEGGYSTWSGLNNYYECAGIVLGFVGLLGIYDEKIWWIRVFSFFVYGRILVNIFSFCADLIALASCTSATDSSTVPLLELAESGLCSEGRIAFIFGFVLDFAVWAYFTYVVRTWHYYVELNPPYAISFGLDKNDRQSRWEKYQVDHISYYNGQLKPQQQDPPAYDMQEREQLDLLSAPAPGVGRVFRAMDDDNAMDSSANFNSDRD